MLTVEELIGNLLLRHNCVIVPSFGGFVAKQSSATIDYKNGIMLPPRKSVLFNRQLVNNDGLLVSEFSTVNKVYYTAAEENVRERVSEWNEKLRNGERVTLDRVGYLFYDQEKNICFEQDRFFNLLLESYGLGKVHFVSEEDIQVTQQINAHPDALQVAEENIEQPIIQLVPIPVAYDSVEKTETTAAVIDHIETRSLSKVWRYVAAAVLLPIGFYSFWIPMKTNVLESGVLSINDFNLGYRATEGYYEKTPFKGIKFEKEERLSLEKEIEGKNVSEYPLVFDDFLNIRVSIPNNTETPIIQSPNIESVNPVVVNEQEVEKVIEKKVQEKKVSEKIPVKEGNFSFIVGSYTTEEHANEYVAELKAKGLQGFIIQNGATYRVSTGSASTQAEITAIGEKTKAGGISGWVLKR